MTGRGYAEEDLFGTALDYSKTVLEWATAGWDGVDDVEDLGTADNGGRTLIRATLFAGKPQGVSPKPGKAAGYQVLVQITYPLYMIPPKGTQLIIAFPGGDIQTPGAGAVIAQLANSPTVQFKKSRAVLDVGKNMDLVIKARSVTITDHGASETPSRYACYVTVGPPPAGGNPGVLIQDPTGSGMQVSNGAVGIFAASGGDAKAVIQLSADQLSMLHKTSGFVKLTGGNATVGTSNSLALVGGNVSIGANATVATPALVGLSSVAGFPSTSVFISA